MSALIKAASEPACTILSFGQTPQQAQAAPPSKEAVLETRIAALEADAREAERRLPELLDQAKKDGATKALRARNDAEAEKLECLERGLSDAKTSWSERLAALDGLSATLTRAILAQVFADDAGRIEATISAIKRRLTLLEGQAVIGLRVSSSDFPDARALEPLAVAVGGNLSIQSDAKIEAGECVLDLKLGHIDVGPAAQWPRIAEFLDRIEREGLGS